MAAPQHLNNTGCTIKVVENSGRGVYAERAIPRGTLLEISPVLLFEKQEYEQHGKYTVLDHYTFIWPNGRMALALGLGSLFNHNDPPNVTFTLDTATESIRYTTVRDIQPGEELCIFYGHNLWFTPAGMEASMTNKTIVPESDDGWGGLTVVSSVEEEEDEPTTSNLQNPYASGNQDEIIAEDDLPFARYKLPPEEETHESIRTVEAWVVDVPEARFINTLIKWLRQADLETDDVAHLKRIRKKPSTGQSTLLLRLVDPDLGPSSPPPLPSTIDLPEPYLVTVPASAALTMPSLLLKSALWPTMYTPKRKDEFGPWTRDQAAWAWDAMRTAINVAQDGKKTHNELPIAAVIPASYGDPQGTPSFSSHDTRKSTSHPLRHAAINAIRKLADYHAAHDSPPPVIGDEESIPAVPADDDNADDATAEAENERSQNGSNYLLTGRSVFLTHEPCIMCSMSLLHSRVKDVFYLYPMPKTGGCGSLTCLPMLKGVNHRFAISQWRDFDALGLLPLEEKEEGGRERNGSDILHVTTDIDA